MIDGRSAASAPPRVEHVPGQLTIDDALPRPRLLSLFSGYGGLDLAVAGLLGAQVIAHAEIEPAARRVLAHRFPGVPNLGDVSEVDWRAVGPVDVISGGFPCQDVSLAGRRLGIAHDTRSGLWGHMAAAVAELRPRLVVIENVRGLLSARAHHPAHSDMVPCPWCLARPDDVSLRALGAVLGDLSDLGYDAAWATVRAADVGAPHGRARVFVVARPADPEGRGEPDEPGGDDAGGREVVGALARAGGRDSPGHPAARVPVVGRGAGPIRSAVADPDVGGREGWAGLVGSGRRTEPADRCGAVADPDGDGREGLEGTPAGRHPVRADVGGDPDRRGGDIAPERVMGHSGHADTAEDRSGEALRDLRGPDGTEAVRRPARGPDPVPQPPQLFPGMREHQGRGDEGCAPLARPEAPETSVRDVRGDGGSARSPQGPDAVEQLAIELDDPLRVLPPAVALAGGPGQALGSGCGCAAWGQYAPAIHRWEMVLGRFAPAPTELSAKGGHRLSPRAVEFMMGLPDGWVTDVPGVSRSDALRLLGNGVVPRQAAVAVAGLLAAWDATAPPSCDEDEGAA